MKKLLKDFYGFTLAEVLISLVIIGIIAAITVPFIYANYQERSLKSALKKNYSVLKQALDKYYIDNGVRLKAGQDGLAFKIKSIMLPYLNVMTDCGKGTESKSCIPNINTVDDSESKYKNYNGTTDINYSCFDDGQFVLNDGSIILIQNSSVNQIYISVDVNGFGRKPNQLGKDLFMFQLMEDGELLP
ncbi:MAG: prepilin-type N-terminal cleavage/methylation domain-containing protein, partial [Candidatus Gastranaerophilales bacterium]|nr:prepilin-type N-terminal cleavage/methylation domain-containing protein [Candidatus Gastranaerophilales bacterium]